MSCNEFDWKGYALGELSKSDRARAEAHAAGCASCREELAATRLTLDALSTLREEEVPRRIAFVSDKVFEPRWWQRVFSFVSQPTFAAACVIAAAILLHGFASPKVDQQTVESIVTRAVADSRQKYERDMKAVLEQSQQEDRLAYIQNTGLVRQ
ncbi:MAG TPA: zf-HC2 domain-containing protein [Bryobacteraceae bacterium]|nr:zf-HC2 domain-containing protein [Bryobacteraceae bacterium]